MQIKNLKQLFFILVIGLFSLQTSTLFCLPIVFKQNPNNPNLYINAETGNIYNKAWKTFTDSEGRPVNYQLSEVTFEPPLESSNPSSSSLSFLQRPSSSSNTQSRLSTQNLSFLSPQQSQQRLSSFHSVDGQPSSEDFLSFPPSRPPSRQDSVISAADPEGLTFGSDDQTTYPSVPRLESGTFSRPLLPFDSASSISSSSADDSVFSISTVQENDYFPGVSFAAETQTLSQTELDAITKFLDPSLVLAAQLGAGKLNPTEKKEDRVAIRTSQSIFDRSDDLAALPFQFYEAGGPNLLGFSYGDDKDKNPEKAGIFGRQKSTVLEDSVMHKTFRTQCQRLSQQFHTLCTDKFEQLKTARDAEKNGPTPDEGFALWSISHKFLTLPSYLVYLAETLEITKEISRLCQREGVDSSKATGTQIKIERGNLEDAQANTPTTTVFELATQIAEILFGRGSELDGDLKKLEKNTAGDGLDTILLVNGQYLNEGRAGQTLAGMKWSVHEDFEFKEEKPEQVTHGSAAFLRADAQMRYYFAEIANHLQNLLIYLTTAQPTLDTNVLADYENNITNQINGMISYFFSSRGFGRDLAKPILELAQVSESWRLVISTLIENDSHLEGRAKDTLEKYADFVNNKEKYGMKGPKYEISKELETFCEQRSEFFADRRPLSGSSSSSSDPVAYVEQITQKNGFPVELARHTLFALRDQDYRLPVDDQPDKGALCLNCGHSPFSLALVIQYLSNQTNQLYKVFFEDDQTFNGNDPKRESLDEIARKLWTDSESLSDTPHARNLLDFVHNPMSFRCTWCRHLQRVWSRADGTLAGLFQDIYQNVSNQETFRLPIAGFSIEFPANTLTFPADQTAEQLSFQTIGVDYQALNISFNRKQIDQAFPGIQPQEITEFKLRIARTIQDLFGAWMTFPERLGGPTQIDGHEVLTPSTKWTDSGLSIALPTGTTFQGGGSSPSYSPTETRPGSSTQTSETLGSKIFEAGEDKPYTPASLKRRRPATLPNRPSSSLTGPTRPPSSSSTATSSLTRRPSSSSLVPPPLESGEPEEGRRDPSDLMELPENELTAGDDITPSSPTSPGSSRRRRVRPKDESTIEEAPGDRRASLNIGKGNIKSDYPASQKFTYLSKLTTTPEFEDALRKATSLLEEIDKYKNALVPQLSQNPSLTPPVQDLAQLGQDFEKAIRTAQQTANDGNPEQAESNLIQATGNASRDYEQIVRSIIDDEEGRAAANLSSMNEKMAALSPIISAAHKLASNIQTEASKLTAQGNLANEAGRKNEAIELLNTAKQLLEISENPLNPIIESANSILQNPEAPFSAELVTELNDGLGQAQERYNAILMNLKDGLKLAEILDLTEKAKARLEKEGPKLKELHARLSDSIKEAEKRKKRSIQQDETDRSRLSLSPGAFFGPNSLTGRPVTSTTSEESPFGDDFSGEGGQSFDQSPHDLNPRRINVNEIDEKIFEPKRIEITSVNADVSGIKTRKRSRSNSPTPPTSSRPENASPRRRPSFSDPSATLDRFEEDVDLPEKEDNFPLVRQQSLISEEGQETDSPLGEEEWSDRLTTTELTNYPPEGDELTTAKFSSDGMDDTLTLYNPPTQFSPSRTAANRAGGFPQIRPFLSESFDAHGIFHPANQNVHELDQSSAAFPSGIPQKGSGFGNLMDSQIAQPIPTQSKFSPSPYFQQYGSGYDQIPPPANTRKPAAKERTLQAIANDYWKLLDPGSPISNPGSYYAQIGPKIEALYNETSKHSGQGQYQLVRGGNLQQKRDLLDTIKFWVEDTANPKIPRSNQKIVLGRE